VNLDAIEALVNAKGLTKVTVADFVAAGLVSKKDLVKVLGNGALTVKVDVEANAFSKSAEAAIQAVGGTVTKL
jgi:large subunit ribosomal protein L15